MPTLETRVLLSLPPPRTISAPTLSVVPFTAQPERTYWMPPASTVLKSSVPPLDATSVPPRYPSRAI